MGRKAMQPIHSLAEPKVRTTSDHSDSIAQLGTSTDKKMEPEGSMVQCLFWLLTTAHASWLLQ